VATTIIMANRALPSSSAQAHKGLLRPTLVETKLAKWRDIIRGKLGSGGGNLRKYASQTSPSWSTQNLVRRNEPALTFSCPCNNFRKMTYHQHQSGQGIACYTTNFRAAPSTTTRSLKYSITADWKMTNFGITNFGGASSPMFVENGAN